MSNFVSRREVAQHFAVTPDTVKNWEKKGLVKPSCIINGRPRYELNEVIESVTKSKGGGQCK